MALKRKIDKAAFDKLSKDLQAEYVEKDGEYVLDVEGGSDDDNGALRRAKDRAVQERKDAEKRAREAEEKLAELDDNDARKKGDIEKLEASWKDKHEKQKEEYEAKLATKDKFISTTLVDSVAQQMASKISTSPALILPHIKARLQADLDGETPSTKVLDASGNVSAATVADLEKEFVDNKDFASIIVASKAKGGGAPDKGQQRQGGASQQPGDKPAPLAAMSGADLAATLKAKKEADANAD